MWVGKVNCLWHNAPMPETLPRPCSVAAALALLRRTANVTDVRFEGPELSIRAAIA